MESYAVNRRKLCLAISGACSISLLSCINAPITGRQQFMIMPEAQELQMGSLAFKQVLQKEKVTKNKKLSAMVSKVGQKVAKVSGKANYKWEFVCFESKQVNAFCLPGGKIGIYTGILPITKNEAGLAAVIGHEVGHAVARHGAERFSQQFAAQGLLVGLSAYLSSNSSNSNNAIMAALGLGLQVGVLLPYSRKQEYEADHIGTVLMAKAGYKPVEAVNVWKRMKARGGKKPPEYLSTHPADDKRIANLQKLLPEASKHLKS